MQCIFVVKQPETTRHYCRHRERSCKFAYSKDSLLETLEIVRLYQKHFEVNVARSA